jgi:hypothetical protein
MCFSRTYTVFTNYCAVNPFVNLNFKTGRNILFDINNFLMAVDSYYYIMVAINKKSIT